MPVVEDVSNLGEAEASKEELASPKIVAPKVVEEDDDDDDEDIDETIVERLAGLTEMFPETVRNVSTGLVCFSIGASKWLYSVGRVGMWVAASSATMLALPVMFEIERSQMEEQQLAQQRQILLGPNAAVAGGVPSGMMHQVAPPQR